MDSLRCTERMPSEEDLNVVEQVLEPQYQFTVPNVSVFDLFDITPIPQQTINQIREQHEESKENNKKSKKPLKKRCKSKGKKSSVRDKPMMHSSPNTFRI